MYHPHSDENDADGARMMGFFIVHPRASRKVDRDFAILLAEWAIPPGTSRPNPFVDARLQHLHVQQPGVAWDITAGREERRPRSSEVREPEHG